MIDIKEKLIPSDSTASKQPSMQEILPMVQAILEEKIPFNKLLEMKVHQMDEENISVKLAMRPDLIGNFARGILHGGVISTVLDVVGGFRAFIALIRQNLDLPLAEKIKKFSRLSTIDLRVDFLRPGVGEYFIATAYMLRFGSRVAVTRMELHNDVNKLIAVGTGSYTVS